MPPLDQSQVSPSCQSWHFTDVLIALKLLTPTKVTVKTIKSNTVRGNDLNCRETNPNLLQANLWERKKKDLQKERNVRTSEGLPDELGLHGVVERHEHLGILPDLTHNILQSHKEGKRRRGGELGLPGQINILLLTLSGGETEGSRSVPGVHPWPDQWVHPQHQCVKKEIMYKDVATE